MCRRASSPNDGGDARSGRFRQPLYFRVVKKLRVDLKTLYAVCRSRREAHMPGSRALRAVVLFVVTAVPGGVFGQFPPECVSSYDWKMVTCPGWNGGESCPSYQNWRVCGRECDNPP